MTAPICTQCHNKPCYFENGHYHNYCGKTCAAAAGVFRRAETGVRPPSSGPEPQDAYLIRLASTGQQINFYDEKFNPQTAFLGNFHTCNVGSFPCAEALYQAAKFLHPEESIDSPHNDSIVTIFRMILRDQGAGQMAWEMGQRQTTSPDRKSVV